MRTPQKLRTFGLLGIAPLAAVGILGGADLAAGSESPVTLTGIQGVVAQQAATASSVDDFIAKLAANLGIDEQKLRDALKTTSLAQIDQAEADGKITADEATRMRDTVNSGTAPLFGIHGFDRGHGGGPGFGRAAHVDDEALATFLGIDETTLRTELQSGKTLAQEAEAHGKTRDQLKAFLTQEFNAKIDSEQQAGRITADQATSMKQNFADNLDAMIDGTGGPHGRPGFPGGRHGRGDDGSNDQATPRGGA